MDMVGRRLRSRMQGGRGMRLLFLIFAVWLVAAPAPRAAAQDVAPEDLVLTQVGTLPIILTAPHGGRQPIPGIPPRDVEGKPKGGSQYHVSGDRETDVLVQAIAREIRQLTGEDVYLVMAKFQRKFIDANRPPKIAYDNAKAAPYYQYYHQTIRQFIDAIRNRHRAGLLIDVHGQDKLPDSLVRGTRNGRTIQQLVSRAGMDAVTGVNGLFGQLAENGFKVFPNNDVPASGTGENGAFNGGFTVAQYGSQTEGGIDAVQFEFGTQYRQKAELENSAKRAAKSIVGFYAAYLKLPQGQARQRP
jgi:N-formylglutamate amidohydrolase